MNTCSDCMVLLSTANIQRCMRATCKHKLPGREPIDNEARTNLAHSDRLPRDPLLVEREQTHGTFQFQAQYAQELKAKFRQGLHWNVLRPDQREALEMIATKISRVLHGNAQHQDTWDDIAGYAKLGSEACDESRN